MTFTGREMRSLVTPEGELILSLDEGVVGDPGDDEVVVRVEAAPINPSDLGLMVGPADVNSLATRRKGNLDALVFEIPSERRASVRAREGQSLAIGNEGAGMVVAAGKNVRDLEGKLVGMIGGAMYADYRKIAASEVVPLPAGATAEDGAAMFVNPLTALGFVETARREGHAGIVHTAAASNLGQMLQKICIADGIPLVNIVRSPEQAQILHDLGASHVVNSRDHDFIQRLRQALGETGATIAFDAIGGGSLGSEILKSMEHAAAVRSDTYSRYGSNTFKQLYIYGALDPAPTALDRLSFGFQWSAGGWLLFPFLNKAGPEVTQRLRARVLAELTTTFASRYTRVIGLAEALDPSILKAYERKATGEKYLINPTRG